ncbi:macro domain-containing protein [Agrobacterium sp. B1(2019)]|uniref:macro domain-containing protein n=1 Tax=Agrobacterium sp. B1(2019) TaxID=2607032 RepID=UPI001659D8B5|nr:macro domain-containing protein [Agrobacterium sp. B1(2019)]
MKVGFFDKRLFKIFLQITSVVSASLSTLLLFVDLPDEYKALSLAAFAFLLLAAYVSVWIWSNQLNHVEIKIDGTSVAIKVGDIFLQPGLKAIAFNEYFDTQVDNRIISEKSLNGLFVKSHLKIPVEELDQKIASFVFEEDEVLGATEKMRQGKNIKYRLGTIYVYDDYLLTAMSKFDESNRAVLTMPEYLEFLVRFWDQVNKVYAQQSVSTPIFGSGITRIKGHKNISDEDLLKIMLWTFRISEMRFKYPANLSIIIHKDKIDQINLLDMKLLNNGV